LLALLGNMFALLADVFEHPGGQSSECTWTQTREVLWSEFVHVEHVPIVQNKLSVHH